ncbi:hypothetical protein JSE7799_01367 [Jannaschia seosinensis]|uniref:Uncharacterized protein n=1 Tax=Jannaschia seosinensis TaxID=313367 RepID=A0A0M7B7G6_9RHOB|nr:hypothetical protein [Jannaschia seosinensis]CUH38136.1 hypothetical protein JSE7799_01367 [Jannaschia seosinensis]
MRQEIEGGATAHAFALENMAARAVTDSAGRTVEVPTVLAHPKGSSIFCRRFCDMASPE